MWKVTGLFICALQLLVAAGARGDSCTPEDEAIYRERVLQAVKASWRRPYPSGALACTLLIKQNFRGEVLDVGIANCGDDPRVHKSFVDAAYLASPVPLPASKACFSRDVIIRIESRG